MVLVINEPYQEKLNLWCYANSIDPDQTGNPYNLIWVFYIHAYFSILWFFKWKAKILIRARGYAVWSGLRCSYMPRRPDFSWWGANRKKKKKKIEEKTTHNIIAKSKLSLKSFTKIHKTKENITETRLYNFDPLKFHFYIVKLGFTGIHIIFLKIAKKT